MKQYQYLANLELNLYGALDLVVKEILQHAVGPLLSQS